MRIILKHNKISNFGFTLSEFIVALIILIVILLCIPEIEYTSENRKSFETRKMKLWKIKDSIKQYNVEKGKFPKNLGDLTTIKNPYFSKVPIDPFSGYADWEVCEKGYDFWYSTSYWNYQNELPKWNPAGESSIFDVRFRHDIIEPY